MTRTLTDRHGDTVAFQDTPEFRDRVIDSLAEWFSKHGTLGEAIVQNDKAWESATDLLAELADTHFQFERH